MSEDPPKKEDPVPDAPQDQQAPSGLTYSLVTKYWPRVAAGLVALAALAEWIVGGLTSNGALESYVFAWAVTTAGLWFLFDKAEAAMSARSRKQVVRWMQETELRPSIESMPAQFALMFDKLFGERHWSRRRFNRSCWASAASVLFLVAVRASSGDFPQPIGGEVDGFSPLVATTIGTLFFLGAVVPFNFIPDYLSLVETRWAIRRMETKGRVPGTLVLDLAATALISFFGMLVVTGLLVLVSELLTSIMSLVAALGSDLYSYEPIAWRRFNPIEAVPLWFGYLLRGEDPIFGYPVQVAFLSAFFTSVWLWLYFLAVLLSQALLRMNSGIGFLLRVTDVERQPIRSMGFVSVLITSVLFLLGLPLVLW